MRQVPRAGQAGFTLVEVLVSIVLSATAVIGIIALYRVQTSASGFSRRATEGAVVAEDQLERMRTMPAVATLVGPELVDERGKVVVGGFFSRTWQITPQPAFGYADLRVTVTWTDDVPRTITVIGRRSLP